MNKKVYFAGSIRGGRKDAALYREIIEYIERTDTVLTEHVGDLSLSVYEKGRSQDGLIYDQDTGWLKEADLVIAECTNPSLGVGYELCYAEERKIPCYCFYDRSRTELSAMLTGDPWFQIVPYKDKSEIFTVLKSILERPEEYGTGDKDAGGPADAQGTFDAISADTGPEEEMSKGTGTGHLQRLDRKLVFKGGIVDFYQDTVQLPDGKIEKWDYVHHKKGCGACIVPVLPDGRILMVRQYRPAIGETIYELPAGGKDAPDEDMAVTAKRELLEETGYTTDHLAFLCRIRTAVAWCNEYTDIYLAEDIFKKGRQHLDEAEEISVYAFTPERLLEMIASAELSDAKSVAGIMSYLAAKRSRKEKKERTGGEDL